MSIDTEAMLQRVVAEVFDQNFTVEDTTSNDDPSRYSVRMSSGPEQDRTVIIEASSTWMHGFIPELNVQTGVLNDDDCSIGALSRS